MQPYLGAVEVGRAMPRHLTIKVATDAYQWETVFDGDSGDTPDREVFSFPVGPRRVKQVWVLGTNLQLCESWALSLIHIYEYRMHKQKK